MDTITMVALFIGVVAYLAVGLFVLGKIALNFLESIQEFFFDPITGFFVGAALLLIVAGWPVWLVCHLTIFKWFPLTSPTSSRARDEQDLAPLTNEFEPAPVPLAGAEGVTTTPLRPWGKVRTGKDTVQAKVEFGFLAAGVRVRVTGPDANGVVVEPVDD